MPAMINSPPVSDLSHCWSENDVKVTHWEAIEKTGETKRQQNRCWKAKGGIGELR